MFSYIRLKDMSLFKCQFWTTLQSTLFSLQAQNICWWRSAGHVWFPGTMSEIKVSCVFAQSVTDVQAGTFWINYNAYLIWIIHWKKKIIYELIYSFWHFFSPVTDTHTFTFSHLADTFIQSDLQMRTIEAMKTNKRATTYKCYDKSRLA